MEASEKIAVVEKYVRSFDESSLELIKEIFADDAIVEDPVGTEQRNGIGAIAEFYKTGFEANAKLELTSKPRCAGNSVAFSFDVVMTGMKISVTDVFEFNDAGKVVLMKAYWGPENVEA
ncbi:MAG: nuclear transport factor 2 family protein [Pseudomonadales bacterium]